MKKEVRPIPYEQVTPWLLNKHYAKRVPGSVMYSFGLYIDGKLTGVLTYGMSPNSQLNEICGMRVIELNRLVINDGIKNAASYFISETYKYLKNYILLSYADDKQGHRGFIYQACNWIYTGESIGGTMIETEIGKVHKRAYDQRKNKEVVLNTYQGKKHRYFYVPSKDKKIIKSITDRFPQKPYPKKPSVRYDTKEEMPYQKLLF